MIKLLHKLHPGLNYLIINAKAVGELIHHMHADYKYVLFEQSYEPVWKKLFLDIDRLEDIQDNK